LTPGGKILEQGGVRSESENVFPAEIITIRFAGWIYGRIVSLQSDTDIQKLLSNWNRIRISEMLLSMFRGLRLLEKLHIAQSFIQYLQKHLFISLLCHASESVYGVISEP